MNIFFLDTDTKQCAKYHCDKHVVKMILSIANVINTAHRVLDEVSLTHGWMRRSIKQRIRIIQAQFG